MFGAGLFVLVPVNEMPGAPIKPWDCHAVMPETDQLSVTHPSGAMWGAHCGGSHYVWLFASATVSLHHVDQQGNALLGWRLYLPETCTKDKERRQAR
jgi:hypothetical protein